MKFLAVILSCLILTLSAVGGGRAFPFLESGGVAEAVQAECCGCCCECSRTQDDDAADDSDSDAADSAHKGCPFCVSNTCPGFAAVLAASAPAMAAGFRSAECIFIQHKYISPSADGIWQPPKTA